MANKKRLVDLDLSKNEIQNAVIQNLATPPSNPKEGQFYFNTSDKTLYVYANSQWVNALSQGAIYTEGNGIDISNTTISIDTNVVATQSDINNLANVYINQDQLGVNNGVATLDNTGKVPSSQLPAFVDDVIDAYIVSGATALSSGWLSKTSGGSALTPETDKIYVILSSGEYQNKTYRWSGSTYVEISSSPAQATESLAGIAEIATQTETNTGTDDQRIVTPLKLATYTNGMTKKFSVNNTALTPTSGVCTWTITNTIGNADVNVTVKEISTNEEVIVGIATTASTITIKINSITNIVADTYKAIIIG